VGIAVTVYSLAQSTEGLVDTQRRSKIPTVFRDPSRTNTTPVPTKEYKFPDTYKFDVGEEGAYKLFAGVLSYDFPTFEEADLDRNIEVDLDSNDAGLYEDLIKKHIDDSDQVNEAFFSLEIPRLAIRTLIYKDIDISEGLFRGWWMLPQIYNTREGEKIIFCERNAYEATDERSCYYLNEVKVGDYILIYSQEGDLINYRVISTTIVEERVDTVLKPSEDNYLRLITSSDKVGGISRNDHRIVIVSELVNTEDPE
jgi:LPXTG-site transpeptidase (sortase) family protein